nr:hypothetical protein [Sicyoidochytrium minutum DNA virus]
MQKVAHTKTDVFPAVNRVDRNSGPIVLKNFVYGLNNHQMPEVIASNGIDMLNHNIAKFSRIFAPINKTKVIVPVRHFSCSSFFSVPRSWSARQERGISPSLILSSKVKVIGLQPWNPLSKVFGRFTTIRLMMMASGGQFSPRQGGITGWIDELDRSVLSTTGLSTKCQSRSGEI